MLATFPEGEKQGEKQGGSKGNARGKIENGMALLFKILNRKWPAPLDWKFPVEKFNQKLAMPLTTLLRKEPPPEGKPWRKARLHIFAEKVFVGKLFSGNSYKPEVG